MKRCWWAVGVAVWVACGPAGGLRAADWPAYRHDLARSGVTREELRLPLYEQWSVHPGAPKPAWPEPGRELNRVAFDYVHDVTVAKGMAYFGSSADDKVTAVDLKTGRSRWSFFTGGAVRFAPPIEKGRVFVGSDDGVVYCLSAADGKLLWRFGAAPGPGRIMGNGQLISRWPVRSGVGVEGGVVYFAAGMWPSEGVYVYALRAEDGKVLWENDTSGTDYLTQPHPGAFSMTGVAPQGYVLGQGGQIFLPTGRNVPAAYDRKTGKLLYYRSAPTGWGNRWGGSWNFLAEGMLFGWRCHHGPDIDVQLGEYKPDPADGIVAFDAKTGKERREFAGKLRAVVRGDTLYAAGGGKVCAYDLKAWAAGAKASQCTRWEVPHGRVYALILAGDALVVGGQGTVTLLGADSGRTLWQDEVKGQARGLAVADGRLLVSTTDGGISCYRPQFVAKPGVTSPKADTSVFRTDKPDSPAAVLAGRILERSRKKAGHCVVLGAGGGRLLYHLAKQSQLSIHCLEPDAEKVASARLALDAAGLYGVRVTVHQGSLRQIAYPDYLADLIVLGDGVSADAKQCSAAELHRVLRPYGGVAYIRSAQPPGAAKRWLLDANVPPREIEESGDAVVVVRGELPGSSNWTHQYATAARTGGSTDRRARLPLKLLWFGKPGPARLISRHWGGPAPLCVDGRMFVIGQRSLIAVDAYNGRPLWRRDFRNVGWWPVRTRGSSAAADADGVYLVQGKTCLRLEAATGRTVQTYRMPPAPAAAAKPKGAPASWSYLAVGHGRVLGSAGGRSDARRVFVLGKDGKTRWTYEGKGVVGNNALSMDRKHIYLIDRTSPAEITAAGRRGRKIAVTWELVALDAATGKVAWRSEEGIQGRTELWLADGVLLATSGSGMTGYSADRGKRLYAVKARIRRFPVIVNGTIYAEPYAYDLRTGEARQRTNPLTGESSPWSFRRSYGCGAIAGGANMLLFRSGTLGMYDLAGDGGVYNFGGVRAGCYVNAIAAGGLVLCPPADAGCTCSYSYRTTVALMPAERQRDWSVFHDQLPTGTVRQGTFNLGATGDRRDADKRVWLALPRPQTRSRRPGFAEPFRFSTAEDFGPYRRDTDRVRIAGTDRPWLYASGLKGPLRAEFDLEVFPRGFTAWPTPRPPAVDGEADDTCWDGFKPVGIARDKATLLLRHDAESLYLTYKRPRPVDKKGKVRPWNARTKGADAPVWSDDSFELYLSSIPADRKKPSDSCLHLGVSPTGARYDGFWQYATPRLPGLDIPAVEIVIDGKADDWGEGGLKVTSLTGQGGRMRAAKDFDPSFRIGWCTEGLLLLARITDNVIHEWEDPARPWMGDSIDVFVAPGTPSTAGYRCVITPGADGGSRPRARLYDFRGRPAGAKLSARVAGTRTPDGYLVEAMLPWKNLAAAPRAGGRVAVQLIATDDDLRGDRWRFRAMWHKSGEPTSNPRAYQSFRLADRASDPIEFKRGRRKDREGYYTAVRPHPLPVAVPALGASPEDAKHAPAWSSAVKLDAKAFAAELAIPWKTLAEAGIDRGNLMADIYSRGPLRSRPVLGQRFERLIPVPEKLTQPRKLAVRLHFAELDDVAPGQRVFDVKLQGKCVLENFDVVAAAGGTNKAVVKEFNVVAARALVLELVGKSGEASASTAPILSAIEIRR